MLTEDGAGSNWQSHRIRSRTWNPRRPCTHPLPLWMVANEAWFRPLLRGGRFSRRRVLQIIDTEQRRDRGEPKLPPPRSGRAPAAERNRTELRAAMRKRRSHWGPPKWTPSRKDGKGSSRQAKASGAITLHPTNDANPSAKRRDPMMRNPPHLPRNPYPPPLRTARAEKRRKRREKD